MAQERIKKENVRPPWSVKHQTLHNWEEFGGIRNITDELTTPLFTRQQRKEMVELKGHHYKSANEWEIYLQIKANYLKKGKKLRTQQRPKINTQNKNQSTRGRNTCKIIKNQHGITNKLLKNWLGIQIRTIRRRRRVCIKANYKKRHCI